MAEDKEVPVEPECLPEDTEEKAAPPARNKRRAPAPNKGGTTT